MSEISAVDSGTSFEGYIDSWRGEMPGLDALENMRINSRTIIDIAFCSFDFEEEGYLPGLEFAPEPYSNTEALLNISRFVQDLGGIVKLSFGGETYPLFEYLEKQGPIRLAADIANTIKKLSLDGVDLDIEENEGYSDEIVEFVYALRSDLGINSKITLTVRGQDWSAKEWIKKCCEHVTAVTFMKCNIWVPAMGNLVTQIKDDINMYISEWGIPAHKLQLGLLPGFDEKEQFLSVEDAKDLAKFARKEKLAAVVIRDLNNDFEDVTGEGSFVYTHSLEKILGTKRALR